MAPRSYFRSSRGTRSEPRRDPTQAYNPQRPQEMGIAAGGKLVQDIVRDTSPNYVWNKARAKLVDIHILHPSAFEAVTHVLAPKTPIATEEYLAAGIPFYAIEEDPDQRLDGSEELAGVKSVSAMDSHVGVQDGSSTDFDPKKPKRCAKCAVRLCDCMYVFQFRKGGFYADFIPVFGLVTTSSAMCVSKQSHRPGQTQVQTSSAVRFARRISLT